LGERRDTTGGKVASLYQDGAVPRSYQPFRVHFRFVVTTWLSRYAVYNGVPKEQRHRDDVLRQVEQPAEPPEWRWEDGQPILQPSPLA